MGNTSSGGNSPQPNQIYSDDRSNGSQSEGTGSIGAEILNDIDFESERDELTFALININKNVLVKGKAGDKVYRVGAGIFTENGKLGQIPHWIREQIKGQNYSNGFLNNVEKAIITLIN